MSDQPLLSLQTNNKIDVLTYPNFIAEVFDERDDIVYHFYPYKSDKFIETFAQHLEASFRSILPKEADVRAGFVNLMDAKDLERRSGDVQVSESYWVRVKNYASRPLVDTFLKEQIFEILQERIG